MRILVLIMMLVVSLAAASGDVLAAANGEFPAAQTVREDDGPAPESTPAAEEGPAIELSGGTPAAGVVPKAENSSADVKVEPASAASSVQQGEHSHRFAAAPPADQGKAEPSRAADASSDLSPVPWWRSLAHAVGIASDPRPGETALTFPGRPQCSPDYVIGSGDVLGISVWRDENLTRSVVVLPDGKISFPLVGELSAGGKTVSALKREIEGKLARFVTDVGLTVEVKQSNSLFIYVIGRVNSPGRQMLVATTNVLQGLAMAGGLNPFADKGDVKIFRQQGEKTAVFSFDYNAVAEGRHLETNIELQRGDVILVP